MRILQAQLFLGLAAVILGQEYCTQILSKVPVPSKKVDQAAILNGVNTIRLGRDGDTMVVFGENAFPLMATNGWTNNKDPIGAGARLGKGRLIGFSNEDVLYPDGTHDVPAGPTDIDRFLLNIVTWLAGGTKPKNGAIVEGRDSISKFFSANGIKTTSVSFQDLKSHKNLNTFQFIVIVDTVPADAVPVLRKYLDKGGGVALGSTPWRISNYYQFYGRFENFGETFPPNQLSKPFGFLWRNVPDESYSKPNLPDRAYNLSLSYLIEAGTTLQDQWNRIKEMTDPASAVNTLIPTFEFSAQSVPKTEFKSLSSLSRMYRDAQNFISKCPFYAIKKREPATTWDQKFPIRLSDAFTSSVLLPDDVKVSPSTQYFPGLIDLTNRPKPSRVHTRTLTLNKNSNQWMSTGLYAESGVKVTAQVEGLTVEQSNLLIMQIGCHSDDLTFKDVWWRVPNIVRKTRFFNGTAVHNSPYGGLIYVYSSDTSKTGLGPFKFTFTGPVPSPYYKLGETSVENWLKDRVAVPGAWAELESNQVIITVPSPNIFELDDPESLLELWDKWSLAMKELISSSWDRPERAVADYDIAYGGLHAGYPMMGFLGSGEDAVNMAGLKLGQNWGWLHEIGHNLQEWTWTFQGTADVTNNVMVVYALSTVSGTKEDDMHTGLRRENYLPDLRKYKGNLDFENNWKYNYWVALQYYLQLQRAFGWDAFKKTFAAYNELQQGQKPETTQDKIDMWIVFFSKTVGQNLIDFHKSWGFPIGTGVADQLKQYPMSNMSIDDLL